MVNSEVWVGTRYSIPPYPPSPHHPGYTPPTQHAAVLMTAVPHAVSRGVNMVVGLIYVGVRTLSTEISDIRVMTEVYNLVEVEDR